MHEKCKHTLTFRIDAHLTNGDVFSTRAPSASRSLEVMAQREHQLQAKFYGDQHRFVEVRGAAIAVQLPQLHAHQVVHQVLSIVRHDGHVQRKYCQNFGASSSKDCKSEEKKGLESKFFIAKERSNARLSRQIKCRVGYDFPIILPVSRESFI